MVVELIEEALNLSPAELDDRVRALLSKRRELEAELAVALAVVEQRGDFVADGHRSLNAYVRATANCGAGAATTMVRRARLVNEEPEIGELLWAGHLGVAQADRLARASQHPRAGHAFRDVVDQLADHAEHSSWNSFDTEVARFEMLADVDGAHAADRVNIDQRVAHICEQGDGVTVSACGGDALQAAEMIAVFEHAKQDQFDIDLAARKSLYGDAAEGQPLARTAAQRAFDALYEIVMSYVTTPVDGRRPEPIVNLLIDPVTAGAVLHAHGLTDTANVFTDTEIDLALSDRRCETSTGTVVHPDLILRAMIRGHVRRVVADSASVVVDMGRERRMFTGRARTAAQLLVRECSAIGCIVAAEACQVDHLDEHHTGGRTDQANAGPMCGTHNRHKHRHRLRTRRTKSGRIRLIREDGTTITPAGEREPAWAEPLPHALHPAVRSVTWDHWKRTHPRIPPDTPDPGIGIHVITYDELIGTT